jgi:2-methylcitrate dehydratase PrpD
MSPVRQRSGCNGTCDHTDPEKGTCEKESSAQEKARREEKSGQGKIKTEPPMSQTVFDFTKNLAWEAIPKDVQHQSKRCLLDLIGVAAAGHTTDTSKIINDHAAMMFAGGQSALFFDGRLVSSAGAAMANGMTIDSMDAHDGHPLTKGHAGCGVLPALVAIIQAERLTLTGTEFLTTLVVGYEIAIRAGIALHATAPDYHTSGAWVAIAAAAMGTRLMDMDAEQFRHAIGIAEYHGPRSQLMRVVDAPTMLKDGSGWGAMAGVSAAYLSQSGFTGAPAISVEDTAYFDDLGDKWHMMGQYFKLYPVCRWAQPAVEAAAALKQEHRFLASDIRSILIETFHEGKRLAVGKPKSSDEAQYNLPFSVAAFLVCDTLGPKQVTGAGLNNPDVLNTMDKITVTEDETFNARFPAERWARAIITLNDGQRFTSADTTAQGDWDNPPTDQTLDAKYDDLTRDSGLNADFKQIKDMVWDMDCVLSADKLISLLSTSTKSAR